MVRESRRPKPHSVAIEKLPAYFFAVASRRFVPSTPSVKCTSPRQSSVSGRNASRRSGAK